MASLLVIFAGEAKKIKVSQRVYLSCLVTFLIFTPLSYCCERFSVFRMLLVLKLSQKKESTEKRMKF